MVVHEARRLAAKGMVVLAVAHGTSTHLVASLDALSPLRLQFDGLISLTIPVRPGTASAVRDAEQAGIRTILVSGHHSETTYALAKISGIATNQSELLTDQQIAHMDDRELLTALHQTARVVAAASPETRSRIARVLAGAPIAVVAESVSDMPALATATIGVATIAAPQAVRARSHVVLAHPSVASLVQLVRESRFRAQGIGRMTAYVLTVNLGELVLLCGAIMAGWAMPLSPLQIIWINLIMTLFLVVPLGLEQPSRLTHTPNDPAAVSNRLALRIIILGGAIGLGLVGLYHLLARTSDTGTLQALMMCALIAAQWAAALVMRRDDAPLGTELWHLNKRLGWGLLAVIVIQTSVVIGLVANLATTPLGDISLVIITMLGLVLVVSELLKWHSRWVRRQTTQSASDDW